MAEADCEVLMSRSWLNAHAATNGATQNVTPLIAIVSVVTNRRYYRSAACVPLMIRSGLLAEY
jgi:hypothetical protein